MSENSKKISEINKIRKRADTECELRWQRIQQIAQEAREFANYCISRANSSPRKESFSNTTENKK